MILKVKQIEPQSHYLKLIFEKPPKFYFYPGQYLDISLPKNIKDPLGQTRAFTISSSPTEDFLMITTRPGISKFKNYFNNLKAGDEINTSPPIGTFTLDEKERAVFLAGGVGITPFRSMIKYAVDQKLKILITLIYSNSDNNFLFKEELDKWQKHLPKLKIIYHNSNLHGRLSSLPTTYYLLSTIYYLSGSHSFVNSMEKILLDMGIDQTNIRFDRFDGY